jgi:hypothetical protein
LTGQDLLDRMELLNAELQLQSGEADVTKGLLALNVAQDFFESLAAQRAGIGLSKTGTVATALSTETTTFPAGVLRIDRLQTLNASSQVDGELTRIKRVGGHAFSRWWPLYLTTSIGSGKPQSYWTDKTNIYWNPLPDAVYTIRWYGFQRASDLTAGGTFAYDDDVALPMAAFACRLVKMGLDDDASALQSMAEETFVPVLNALSMFNRDGAQGLEYTEAHSE